jgi:hypothetical protein
MTLRHGFNRPSFPHSDLSRHLSFVIRISLLALLLSLPACHQLTAHHLGSWLRTDLYFGLTRRDSSIISDADFQKFIDTTVTPQFPDGLTITPASGQYLDSRHLLHKEPSRILTILYPKKSASEAAQKIRKITTTYCQSFDQESVLQSTTPATAQFLSAAPR